MRYDPLEPAPQPVQTVIVSVALALTTTIISSMPFCINAAQTHKNARSRLNLKHIASSKKHNQVHSDERPS